MSDRDSWNFQGDLYGGRDGQTTRIYTLRPPFFDSFDDQVRLNGGNLLTRWRRAFSDNSDIALQIY